jgi:hypothetical protein
MTRLHHAGRGVVAFLLAAGLAGAEDSARFASHPPLRPLPPPSERPLAGGPAIFVDPARGKDDGDGSEKSPWRTVNHALRRLSPGDTLYLRGGVYHENVYCAAAGRKDAPITLRSYPGERAVLDGGLPEFRDDPAHAWEPYPQGGPGEYRSARPYKNIRDVVGLFGDSNIGLQTYWHPADLRAANELWEADPDKKFMVLPVYCGPGLWYDKASGHIHVRLAHTHLDVLGPANYRGEVDPRKLPLVIAPFHSVPLFVDQAMHVRFQDLVIRGGGHNSVVLNHGIDLEFDGVTVFAGTYGLRARGTGPLRIVHSGIYGMIPPWAFRDENGLYTYSPRYSDPFVPPPAPTNERNIARLPTHAVVVTEGSYEFEVFHYPYNHDWDVSHSEFADGHDGVYLSGHHVRFHHNWVDHFQDDAIYLSSPSPNFNNDIHVSENLITRCFTAFACNTLGGPRGNIYICRNVVDMRGGVHFNRPSLKSPKGWIAAGHIFLVHGGDVRGIESLFFYQNTFVGWTYNVGYCLRTWANTHPESVRRVFNNVFVHLNHYPALDVLSAPAHDLQIDGNLHWCPLADAKLPANFLEQVRKCAASERNRKTHPTGWAANDLVGDPRFVSFAPDPAARNDYRLHKDSPAAGKGVVLPKEWEDPLRPAASGKPDIGALPLGGEPPHFGRHGRVTFPITGSGPP